MNTIFDTTLTMKKLADCIPKTGDYSYFTAFPEFTTLCNNIKLNSMVSFQKIFDFYEPNNGLSLIEIMHLEEGGDYEIIGQAEDFIFAMVDSCLASSSELFESSSCIDALIKDTQDRIHFPLIEYNIITEKPQNTFDDIVDTMDLNFAPKLKIKHNARKDWANEKISRIPGIFFQDDYMRELGIDPQTQLISIYRNPYSYEIHNIEYLDWEEAGELPVGAPDPIEASHAVMIDSEEEIIQLVTVLQQFPLLSVNVIQHSYRSYLGYTSIVAISTPTTDYIVDAIKAHSSIWRLNEVFTNPKVVKVLFSAEKSLMWLQRDFGVFMVNMIDIQLALTLMGERLSGLGEVLMHYEKVYINMRYNRADWRTRPLTEKMILFVRQSVHYNLHIMALAMRAMKQSSNQHLNKTINVLASCNEVCLQTYHKPVQTFEMGESVLASLGLNLDMSKKTLFLSLYYWRDIVGREMDESVQFILPLIKIVDITLNTPSTLVQLKEKLVPMSCVVETRVDRLMKIIKRCEGMTVTSDKYITIEHELLVRYLASNQSDSLNNLLSDSIYVVDDDVILCVVFYPLYKMVVHMERLKRIIEFDRCLFNGITITPALIPSSQATAAQLSEYEVAENASNEQHLKVLLNRGKFRLLASSEDQADKFLVYTPNTLPYNESAPLRNTVPYIPLQFSETEVKIDPVIPAEYINPSVAKFVDSINHTITPDMVKEYKLIREQLNLEHIRSELCHLGSVVEDDEVSFSSDAEEIMQSFAEEFNIKMVPGLPPHSLKEIYQLPHKCKGDDDTSSDEEKKEKNKKEKSNRAADDLDITSLLGVSSTIDMNDAEFMDAIGWNDEAESRAEVASQHIIYP